MRMVWKFGNKMAFKFFHWKDTSSHHAWIEQLHNSGISWKQNGVQIIGWLYSLYKGNLLHIKIKLPLQARYAQVVTCTQKTGFIQLTPKPTNWSNIAWQRLKLLQGQYAFKFPLPAKNLYTLLTKGRPHIWIRMDGLWEKGGIKELV